ncbi:hypothetical protein DMENIID0001_138580 [Sergentomyia squamirostris]
MDSDSGAKNKVEEDIEKHVLSTTVKLSDGTTGKVFSRGGRNEFQVFLYNCHLCGVPNLPGERCLQTHISGRKHQMRLTQGVVDASAFRAPMQAKSKIQMNIAPGEPVPPGFENEVRRIAELQPTLDRNREDVFVGLEYIVELTGAVTLYHCILCDKRGDQNTIINHAISFNHRVKYLDKHYPTCSRELGDMKYSKEARPVITKVLQSVCAAIEETHGRLTLTVHEKEDYERNMMKYLHEIINDKHFDEKTGPKFVKLVDKVKIADQIRRSKISLNLRKRTTSPEAENLAKNPRKRLDSVSSISSSSMKSRSRSPSDRRVRRRSRSPVLGSRRSRESAGLAAMKKSLPTPSELSRQADEIQAERYKWEKYRVLVEKAVEELNEQQKELEKNPEKHPLYPEEWKMFWNRRYKELQQEKKDPAKHDFKPEWIKFWTHRMKELHEDSIEKRKREIKEKLGLPPDDKVDDDEDVKIKDDVEVIKISDSPDSTKLTSRRRSLSPWSDEGSRRIRPSPSRSYGRRRSRSRSISRRRSSRSRSPRSRRSRSRSPSRRSFSPHSRDRYYSREVRYAPPPDPYYNFEEWARLRGESYYPSHKARAPVYNRTATAAPVYARPVIPSDQQNEHEEPDSDEPLTVVSVLRLLTALEEHLGSLGPKCIDLLAKALALEKVKANSADEMLLTEDTCVFFETTKEKLKGQILAGVMEPGKVKAVKKAIKNIAALVHSATRKREDQKANGKDSEGDKDSVKPSSGLDRSKISLKLSTELNSQGKDSLTQVELEQLTEVFIGMLQRSKKKSEIVTVKDFLEEYDVRVVEGGEKTMVDIKKTIEDDFKEDVATSADANALESLTDSDLQTLLQNFKDLSPEEQHHLISYLKKLEATDPTRVEKLRKFVNLENEKRKEKEEMFSMSMNDSNPAPPISAPAPTTISAPKHPEKRITSIYDSDDDDDDDYNFDDVVKAASKNVKEKQLQDHLKVVQESLQQHQKPAPVEEVAPPLVKKLANYPADTQALIANIMGSLQKNVTRSIPTTSSGSGGSGAGQMDPDMMMDGVAKAANMNNLPFYQQAQNSFNPNSYAPPPPGNNRKQKHMTSAIFGMFVAGLPDQCQKTGRILSNFYQGFGIPSTMPNMPGGFNPANQPIFPPGGPHQQQQQQPGSNQQQNQWGGFGKFY